jgi:Uma2 family endonuclease
MDGDQDMPTASSPLRRLTYDDFVRFPDDGLRHEIIDGVHFVSPAPFVRHQVLVGRLFFVLETHLRAHPGTAQVFLAPVDVVLSYYDVVEPDLLLVRGERADILTPRNVQGAPSLVIEVLSAHSRSRDRQLKRDLYQRSGVQEYWLVDPDASRVSVFRRRGGPGFDPTQTLEPGDTLEMPLLPGFSLALAALFD